MVHIRKIGDWKVIGTVCEHCLWFAGQVRPRDMMFVAQEKFRQFIKMKK